MKVNAHEEKVAKVTRISKKGDIMVGEVVSKLEALCCARSCVCGDTACGFKSEKKRPRFA